MMLDTSANPLPVVTQPADVGTTVTQENQTLTLDRSASQGKAMAGFLILWMSIWSMGCIFLLRQLFTSFQLGLAVFSIPFMLAWVGVGIFLLYILFGREKLVINPHGITKYTRVLLYKRARTYPLTSIQSISNQPSGTTVNNNVLYMVAIATTNKTIQFAVGASDAERDWLISQIKAQMGQLNTPMDTPPGHVHSGLISVGGPKNATISSSVTHWTIEDNGRSVVMCLRGKSAPVVGIFLLFFAAVWNGILIQYQSGNLGKGDILGHLFIIPFALIGLLILAAALVVLFAPMITMRWSVDGNELVRRFKIPIIAFTKRSPTDRVNRIRLEKYGNTSNGGWMQWRIVLLDNTDSVGLIYGLRKEQAQAMFDAIKKRFNRWVVDRDESTQN